MIDYSFKNKSEAQLSSIYYMTIIQLKMGQTER